METLTNTLITEPGLTFLAVVFGAAWTFFKSSDWHQRIRERRFADAVTALEAGVERTYQVYVRAIKESSEDGKLTPEERRRARELAREAAIAFGRTQGINVIREIGHDYVDLWIARIVRKLKSAA
jgi:hypothetical protein